MQIGVSLKPAPNNTLPTTNTDLETRCYLPDINDVAIKLGFELNSASVNFLKNRDMRREYMSKYRRKNEAKL